MRRIVTVFLFLLLLSGLCRAQVFRGAISGNVTDPEGAIILGAAVEIRQGDTGQVYKTVSTSAGDFTVQDLPLGDYTVEVGSPGFASLKVDKIRVSAGTVFTLPVKLSIATSSTIVEVDAAGLTLDTTNQVQTYTLPREEVQDIPLNGRSFTTIVNFLPGATGTGSVNGRAGINYMIEGVDNNDPANNGSAGNQGGVGGIPGTLVPIDAIEEFSAQTESSAEVGKFAGAAVNLVIKSGTNKRHGSLYFYDRNEFFAAINPFTTAVNAQRSTAGQAALGKPKIRFFEYGGSLGGPIIKDKTFYFLTFERQQYILSQATSATTEPSAAYVAQATALLATKGITPSPIATALIGTVWQPFMLTGGATSGNYLPATSAQMGYSNNLMAKFDQSIHSTNKLSERWYWGQGSQTAPKSDLNPWYFQVAGMHIHNIAVILNSQLGTKATNQLLLGVDYFNQPFSDANSKVNVAPTGFNVGLGPGNVAGAPTFNLSGFDNAGGQSPFSSRHDFSGHVTDIFSLSLGKHQVRAGGEYRRTQIYEVGNGAGGNGGTRGVFNFSGNRGFAAANGANAGGAYPSSFLYNGSTVAVDSNTRTLADFLQLESSSSTLVNGILDRIASVNNFDLYLSDAYQLTPTLSLNLGLRWDYLSPIGDDARDLSVFRPGTAANALSPSGGLAVVGQDISEPYKASSYQLAPRVGLSWQPPLLKTTVVRASFGLYYDTPSTNTWLSTTGLLGNPAGTKPTYNQALTNPNLGFLINTNGTIFPKNPGLPGLCSTLASATCPVASIAAIDNNFTTADTANYSLNIEKGLGPNVVAQVGYVATQGKHLLNTYDINQTPFGTALNTTPIANGFLPLQYARPYFAQYPNFGQIRQISSAGAENFNSLQAIIKSRSWHGTISEFSYTWSHNLGSNTALPTDSTNPRLDYGNLANDIRHQFKGFFTYDVPGLRRGPSFLTHNWQVAGTLWIHGGKPITASSSATNSGAGINDGADRANLTGNPLTCSTAMAGVCKTPTSTNISSAIASGTTYIQWFNPYAFVSPAARSYGTTRIGQFYGPGYSDFDVSVFKNVPVSETIRLQFRGEMFNLFNRANYANPTISSNSLSLNGAATGQVTTTSGGSSAPGIGAGEPFNVQLALKVLF